MDSYVFVMALHFLSSVAFIAGAILFIFWAYKNLDKKSLKKLSLILIVVGIIGAVITGGAKGKWKHSKELSAEKKTMILEVLDNNDVSMTEEQLDAVLAELKEKKKGKKGWHRRGKW